MPGLPVVLHPDAVEEAHAAWQWYLERSQSAADSFLAEIDHGIESISEAPKRWPQQFYKPGTGMMCALDRLPLTNSRQLLSLFLLPIVK